MSLHYWQGRECPQLGIISKVVQPLGLMYMCVHICMCAHVNVCFRAFDEIPSKRFLVLNSNAFGTKAVISLVFIHIQVYRHCPGYTTLLSLILSLCGKNRPQILHPQTDHSFGHGFRKETEVGSIPPGLCKFDQ